MKASSSAAGGVMRMCEPSIKPQTLGIPEAGFTVSEKVQTQTELSSVSGNPFPSGHELWVFQLELRNRLGGTEDWK